MKTKLLVFVLLLSQLCFAQAPTFTTSAGYPIGNTSCQGVTYGNSKYIAVTNAGVIYTSLNGIDWAKSTALNQTIYKIAFGAGVFVVIGADGFTASSADGISWTTRNSGTINNFYDVQFIQNKFYCVGAKRTIVSSSDGITWTPILTTEGKETDDLMNITYGNSIYLISGRDVGNATLYKSTTATDNSWTTSSIVAESVNKTQFLKDKFYLFSSGTKIFTSTDGSTWINSSATMVVTYPDNSTGPISLPNQMFHGIYDGNKIYFFGYDGAYTHSYGAIFSTTDGTNITLQPKSAYMVCQGATYLNGKYFQYGNEGISTSDDGINYTYSGNSYASVASNGNTFVGVGGIGNSGIILTSTDFTTWDNNTPNGENTLYSVVNDGTKFVAVGDKAVVSSLTGSNWTKIATPNYTLNTVAYGNSTYVCGATEGALLSSSDAVSWSSSNADNNNYFKIRFVNGLFFALGTSNITYEGVIMQSADGINWTNITPTLALPVYYYNDVFYDGSKFHFTGMEYIDQPNYITKFFSISTATPSVVNSFANKAIISNEPIGVTIGGSWGDGVFAYKNGHYVGSGVNFTSQDAEYGRLYVLYSEDGTSWTAMPTDEFNAMNDVVYGNGKFNFVGYGDLKLVVEFAPAFKVTGTPTAFTACGNDVSVAQSIMVSGADLTDAIVVTPPTGFEVSLDSLTNYDNTLNITPIDGMVSQKVFVRIANNAIDNPSGDISFESVGTSSQSVEVIGTIKITDASVTLSGMTATANLEGATYKWYNVADMSYIDNAIYQSFTPAFSNEYSLTITKDGCTNSSDIFYIDVFIITGIENNLTTIAVYPVPASDVLNVSLNSPIAGTASITDIHGNVVASKTVTGSQFNISTAELSSGVYVLKIASAEQTITKQVVIVK
jgi:hypothetical protein